MIKLASFSTAESTILTNKWARMYIYMFFYIYFLLANESLLNSIVFACVKKAKIFWMLK